ASAFISGVDPLAAPRCASSHVCMSVADDLISEAALAHTIRPPSGYACATGAPLGTFVTVSGMLNGPVIWLCNRAEYACGGGGFPPAAQPYADAAVKPRVMKAMSE